MLIYTRIYNIKCIEISIYLKFKYYNKSYSLRLLIMKQNSESQLIMDETFKHKIFNMIFKINANDTFKKQANLAMYMISIVLNLLIFLSNKQIKVLSTNLFIFRIQIYIALISVFSFIFLQTLICLLYKTQFYIGLQFKLTRFIIFPLISLFLFHQISKSESSGGLISLLLIFVLITFAFTALFGSQSFIDKQIYHNHLPISSIFIFLELIFYSISVVTSLNIIMLLTFCMLIMSLFIRNNFFSQHSYNFIQQKVLSIKCFLYCFYSAFIFIVTINQNIDHSYGILIVIISPILIYYGVSVLFSHKTVTPTFTKIFNTDIIGFHQFIVYAQYLVLQANSFNDNLNANFCQTLVFTFYSQHQKNCQKVQCKFFSQNWKQQFKNINDPKTLKKITQKVIRKLQYLFQQISKNQPDNIQLKVCFIKFYMDTLPNKIKVLELISQVQNIKKSFFTEYEIYKLKILSNQMANLQVIDNLKTDDEVNQFQKIAYMTINSMMEFWTHYTEEKIDLQKVMHTSEKLLNYKKEMQAEWEKNKHQQKYSTLKIVLLYSYYLRYVLHDNTQADYLQFFAKALQQKLLHKKQIKYLSFGSQSALIGASLTDDNLGKIVIANNQASNVFNYSKNQINKIGLNEIMPKIFAEQHDHYLLQFHKNRYKQINSDERLLFGKDKYGYIIPILLQLQRTISSMSQQLLFVANIRKYKVKQVPLICITDQEGEISDVSSGFKDVFYEKKEQDKKKVEVPTKNVQQIIPAFFQKNQLQDCGHYKFVQDYLNDKIGSFTVQWTVIPISFPLKANGGFVVMGVRKTPHHMFPVNYINITKQIDSRSARNQISGHKILYNPQKNRYQVDSYQSSFKHHNNSKNQIYTIPFININDMTNIFNLGQQQKNYAQRIRTVRLCQNGALIRVQQNLTFESQQLSQAQKVNRFQFKLKQLKYNYLQNKNNLLFVTIGRLFIILIVCLLVFIFFYELSLLAKESADREILLKEISLRYQIRGFLSQYILSFKGLKSNYNNSYFQNKIFNVKQTLINVIEDSSIEQTKKQPILQIIYLQNQSDLKDLLMNYTLRFKSLDDVDSQQIQSLWIVYILIIGLFLLFQALIKYLHSQKIYGVYTVFLGVDQKMIKKSYDSCLRFSQMLQDKQGQHKLQKKKQHQQSDQDNQNPVSRMKKYKQISRIDVFILAKYFLFLFLAMLVCGLLFIYLKSEIYYFNSQVSIFKALYGLFPQSSIALMNSYFKGYLNQDVYVEEFFNQTYQTMDSKILQYQNANSDPIGQSFFNTLMNDACRISKVGLQPQYAKLCQSFQQSIFLTGVGKVTNLIVQKIQNININSLSFTSSTPPLPLDSNFFNLFSLQYDFYVPIIKTMTDKVYQELCLQVIQFQNKFKIWIGIITLIVVLNSFYIYQFLLQEIKDHIQLTKELLYFIPDSFIEEKNLKYKKKAKTSLMLEKSMDEEE